jgi:hypothetical protein
MTKNIMKIVLPLLLSANFSFAACDLAIMLAGNSPKQDMALKLQSSLEKSLKKLNTKNTTSLVYSPEAASDSDYFLVMTPTYSGIRVAINYILINNTFYTKEYNYNPYISGDQIIAQITSDISAGAFSSMKFCK